MLQLKRLSTFAACIALVTVLVAAVAAFALPAAAQQPQPDDNTPAGVAAPATQPDDNTPPSADLLTSAAAAPVPLNAGDMLVYFIPRDSNGTATVVNLVNTTEVTVTVGVQSYRLTNTIDVTTTVTLAPGALVHLVSDPVAATPAPPPSWEAANVKLTNFTDFSTFAVLSLPRGVQIDGYFVFNSPAGTILPDSNQGAIPLRFSTEPLNAFLPTVLSTP